MINHLPYRFALLFLTALVAGCTPLGDSLIQPSGDSEQNLLSESGEYYHYIEDGPHIRITGLTALGKGQSFLIIPSLIEDKSVTSLGDRAFQGGRLIRVTIPESILSLGDEVFLGNPLESVSLLSSTPPDTGAPAFPSPEKITLYHPAGASDYLKSPWTDFGRVTQYQYAPDAGGRELSFTGITTQGTGPAAVDIPSSIDGKLVTSLGEGAFRGQESLERVTIPPGVTSIGSQAFLGTSLSEVWIPGTVSRVGEEAFLGITRLEKAVIGGSSPAEGAEASENFPAASSVFLEPLLYTYQDTVEGITVGADAFAGSGLVSVEIAYNVVQLEDGALGDLPSLETVKIYAPQAPGLGTGVFPEDLSALTLHYPLGGSGYQEEPWLSFGKKVPLGDVFTIEESDGEIVITGLTPLGANPGVLTIPAVINNKPVTGIRRQAFLNRRRLTGIILPSTLKIIESSAFAGTGLTEITFPSGLLEIGAGAFSDLSSLEKITFLEDSQLTIIGERAFQGTGIHQFRNGLQEEFSSHLRLPQGLTFLGDRAFFASAVEEVSLPVSLESWGVEVFASNPALSQARLPGSGSVLEEIPQGTFQNTGLTGMDTGDNILRIGSQAFQGSSSLREVILGEDLQEIGEGAFRETGLTQVVLPSRLEEISPSVFRGSALTRVEIPRRITRLGESAFRDIPSLKELVFQSELTGDSRELTVGAGAFQGSGLIRVEFPPWVTILGDSAFQESSSLEEVLFQEAGEGGEGLKTLGARVFQGTALTGITLPDSLVSLGAGAFKDLSRLRRLDWDKEESLLESIGDEAFMGTAVGSLGTSTQYDSQAPYHLYFYLPEGLKVLGKNGFSRASELYRLVAYGTHTGEEAFAGTPLKEVIFDGRYGKYGKGSVGKRAFQDVASLTRVHLDVEEIGDHAFGGTSLDYLNISFCSVIGDHAFEGIGELTSVGFNNVGSIGAYAFRNTSLEQISFTTNTEETLESLGDYAFADIEQLESISLPDNLKSIGRGTFQNTSLSSVSLPDSVALLGTGAFRGIETLTSVTLGAGLERIGERAFMETSLESITIPNKVETIGDYAFFQVEELQGLSLGSRLESIGHSAFSGTAVAGTPEGTRGLGALIIPDSVKTIGPYAFVATKVESVVLGDQLETIQEYAFYASSLKGSPDGTGGDGPLLIPPSVKSIGTMAFAGLGDLENLRIGAGIEELYVGAFWQTNLLNVVILAPAAPRVVLDRAYFGPPTPFLDSLLGVTLTIPSASQGYDVSPWTDFSTLVVEGEGSSSW